MNKKNRSWPAVNKFFFATAVIFVTASFAKQDVERAERFKKACISKLGWLIEGACICSENFKSYDPFVEPWKCSNKVWDNMLRSLGKDPTTTPLPQPCLERPECPFIMLSLRQEDNKGGPLTIGRGSVNDRCKDGAKRVKERNKKARVAKLEIDIEHLKRAKVQMPVFSPSAKFTIVGDKEYPISDRIRNEKDHKKRLELFKKFVDGEVAKIREKISKLPSYNPVGRPAGLDDRQLLADMDRYMSPYPDPTKFHNVFECFDELKKSGADLSGIEERGVMVDHARIQWKMEQGIVAALNMVLSTNLVLGEEIDKGLDYCVDNNEAICKDLRGCKKKPDNKKVKEQFKDSVRETVRALRLLKSMRELKSKAQIKPYNKKNREFIQRQMDLLTEMYPWTVDPQFLDVIKDEYGKIPLIANIVNLSGKDLIPENIEMFRAKIKQINMNDNELRDLDKAVETGLKAQLSRQKESSLKRISKIKEMQRCLKKGVDCEAFSETAQELGSVKLPDKKERGYERQILEESQCRSSERTADRQLGKEVAINTVVAISTLVPALRVVTMAASTVTKSSLASNVGITSIFAQRAIEKCSGKEYQAMADEMYNSVIMNQKLKCHSNDLGFNLQGLGIQKKTGECFQSAVAALAASAPLVGAAMKRIISKASDGRTHFMDGIPKDDPFREAADLYLYSGARQTR